MSRQEWIQEMRRELNRPLLYEMPITFHEGVYTRIRDRRLMGPVTPLQQQRALERAQRGMQNG